MKYIYHDFLSKISKLRKSEFIINVSTLAGGTALGQVMVLLASPILTRLYTPDSFGRLGLFTVFMGFSSVLVSLRLEAAIPTPTKDSEAAHLTFLSILLVFPISIVVSTALLGLIHWNVLGFGGLSVKTIPLAFLGIGFFGIFSALRYWIIRIEAFRSLSNTIFLQNLTRAIAMILLGFLGFGWWGLVIGEVLARGVALAMTAIQSWRSINKNIRGQGWLAYKNIFHQYANFPRYVLPSSLIDSLAASLPLPILTHLYGTKNAGYFALFQRIISVPIGLIGKSVADVFHSRMGQCLRERTSKPSTQFLKVSQNLLLIGLGPTLLLMILGPFLFKYIFGPSWLSAGNIAVVAAPWALCQFVVSPVSRVVFVFGGQAQKLIYDCTAVSISIVGLYGAKYLNLSAISAITLFSGLQCLAFGLYFAFLYRIVSNVGRDI